MKSSLMGHNSLIASQSECSSLRSGKFEVIPKF